MYAAGGAEAGARQEERTERRLPATDGRALGNLPASDLTPDVSNEDRSKVALLRASLFLHLLCVWYDPAQADGVVCASRAGLFSVFLAHNWQQRRWARCSPLSVWVAVKSILQATVELFLHSNALDFIQQILTSSDLDWRLALVKSFIMIQH